MTRSEAVEIVAEILSTYEHDDAVDALFFRCGLNRKFSHIMAADGRGIIADAARSLKKVVH